VENPAGLTVAANHRRLGELGREIVARNSTGGVATPRPLPPLSTILRMPQGERAGGGQKLSAEMHWGLGEPGGCIRCRVGA
jgi:hypothetical protein